MALFLRQDEERSELQNSVALDVKKRLREGGTEKTLNDHESTMLENQHQTRRAGMIIFILLVMLMVAVVAFALRISA